MPAAALSNSSYRRLDDAVLTNRQVEYKLFAQVTHRLSAASATCPREAGDVAAFSRLAMAVHDNQRLWTALAIDVASDRNALPESLRAGILSLAGFVRAHGAKVLARDAEAAPLVEVNAAVMKGLRAESPATARSPAASAREARA